MKWWAVVLLAWLGINVACVVLALLTGRRREKLGLKYNYYTDEWEIPTERSKDEGN